MSFSLFDNTQQIRDFLEDYGRMTITEFCAHLIVADCCVSVRCIVQDVLSFRKLFSHWVFELLTEEHKTCYTCSPSVSHDVQIWRIRFNFTNCNLRWDLGMIIQERKEFCEEWHGAREYASVKLNIESNVGKLTSFVFWNKLVKFVKIVFEPYSNFIKLSNVSKIFWKASTKF